MFLLPLLDQHVLALLKDLSTSKTVFSSDDQLTKPDVVFPLTPESVEAKGVRHPIFFVAQQSAAFEALKVVGCIGKEEEFKCTRTRREVRKDSEG